MVDAPKTADDFDGLSDEDFMNLSPDAYSGDVPEGETSLTNEDLHAENQIPQSDPDENADPDAEGAEGVDPNQSPAGDLDPDNAGGDSDPANASQEGEEDPEDQGGSGIDPMAEAAGEKGEAQAAPTEPKPEDKPSEADAGEKGKKAPDPADKGSAPVKSGDIKLPDGMTAVQATSALAFAAVVMAPFKADGKDFTVRSPEDAIKLMQQGVNYSRRMEELKPMKAMNRMLQDHGLNDPQKMSFLIDLAKGDKVAITKLLKDNNLDPMDLDVSVETGYQAKSYAGDPKDNTFRDALDNAKVTPDGQALLSDIHGSWDDASKAQLRENPSILGNMIELKQSGVYKQVVDELAYQRSMGYLTDAPYLQAFDQVGEAMKNAGVLIVNGQPQPQPSPSANPMGQLNNNTPPTGQAVAQGARKVPASKKAAPNPHLSSTPPSKQSANQQPAEQDFGNMSDEDFLKMPPPP